MGRPGSDHKAFEDLFGGQTPFDPLGDDINRWGPNGEWIGNFVQQMIKHSFGKVGLAAESENREAKTGKESNVHTSRAEEGLVLEYELFETHHSVIARIHIPGTMHYKNIRLYAGANELKLELDPSRKKQYIRLPQTVDPDAARAIYKEGILEIRIPRLEEAERFRELRIRT